MAKVEDWELSEDLDFTNQTQDGGEIWENWRTYLCYLSVKVFMHCWLGTTWSSWRWTNLKMNSWIDEAFESTAPWLSIILFSIIPRWWNLLGSLYSFTFSKHFNLVSITADPRNTRHHRAQDIHSHLGAELGENMLPEEPEKAAGKREPRAYDHFCDRILNWISLYASQNDSELHWSHWGGPWMSPNHWPLLLSGRVNRYFEEVTTYSQVPMQSHPSETTAVFLL